MAFENKKDTKYGVHYSRWIASWLNSGGKTGILFRTWLEDMGLASEEITDIVSLATTGKCEFEKSAKKFIDSNVNTERTSR